MVRRGKYPFEVQVTEDYVLFVGVCILHAKCEVRDRSLAGSVRSEALLFRAPDFVGFNIIRGEDDYVGGP